MFEGQYWPNLPKDRNAKILSANPRVDLYHVIIENKIVDTVGYGYVSPHVHDSSYLFSSDLC